MWIEDPRGSNWTPLANASFGNMAMGAKILHNFQTSLYKKELLNEANQKLQWEKKQSQERRRDQERLFNKEKYVAYAWANSETGMKSGITWWDMTESERAHYREKYYEFVFSRKSIP